MYAGRNPQEDTPCSSCRVDALPENRVASDIFHMCRDQLILAGGMGGTQVIGISIPAICDVMDRYPGGIKDQWKCLNKVKYAFHYFQREEGH